MFQHCTKLRRIELPSARELSGRAFYGCHDLRNLILRPDVELHGDDVFTQCRLLRCLAASTKFVFGSMETTDVNTTVILYLKWRNLVDVNKELFTTITSLLKLCSLCHVSPRNPLSATAPYPHLRSSMICMSTNVGRGINRHILSFLGERRGYGDLREATKERLLEVALECKCLRADENAQNESFCDVTVDSNGERVVE